VVGSGVSKCRFRCRAVAASSRFEDAGNYITKLPKAAALGSKLTTLYQPCKGQSCSRLPPPLVDGIRDIKPKKNYGEKADED
jgi:hypothetical protein